MQSGISPRDLLTRFTSFVSHSQCLGIHGAVRQWTKLHVRVTVSCTLG